MHSTWIRPFLDALKREGIVAEAARVARISSTAAYALRRTNADFAAAWDEALEDAMDTVEAAARHRALGYEELVVYQGQLTPVYERDANGQLLMEQYDLDKPIKVGGPDSTEYVTKGQRPVQARNADGSLRWLTITKHSDAMTSLLLKGRRKKVFAERTEVTGADGAPLQVDATARRARIASILEAAKQRVGLA